MDDGVRGVDRLIDPGAEPAAELVRSRVGIQSGEALSHQAEEALLAMDSGEDRGGIAGLFFRGAPLDCAFAGPAEHGLSFPRLLADVFPEDVASDGIEGNDA